jgi:hypothetical protein
VAIEHILKIGANRSITRIYRHHQSLPLLASDKEWRDFALIVMRHLCVDMTRERHRRCRRER